MSDELVTCLLRTFLISYLLFIYNKLYYNIIIHNTLLCSRFNPYHRRRMSPTRSRLAVRWPKCPRTWRWSWPTVWHRTGPWNLVSILLCTATDPVTRHPTRVSCRSAIDPRKCYRCKRQTARVQIILLWLIALFISTFVVGDLVAGRPRYRINVITVSVDTPKILCYALII